MFGLLVGDAVGVPYEFAPPAKLPPREQLEMTPPDDWVGAHFVPNGTWSDDGAQALALADSLLDCQGLNLPDLANRFAQWQFEGRYAVDGIVFDVGITTSEAIGNFRSGAAAHEAGPDNEMSNGNGSLMRVLPLALWHRGDDMALAHDAMAQSLVTHGHLRSQLCCALYCLWARKIGAGAGSEDAWKDATQTLRELLPPLCRAANAIADDDEPLQKMMKELAFEEWERAALFVAHIEILFDYTATQNIETVAPHLALVNKIPMKSRRPFRLIVAQLKRRILDSLTEIAASNDQFAREMHRQNQVAFARRVRTINRGSAHRPELGWPGQMTCMVFVLARKHGKTRRFIERFKVFDGKLK